MKKFLILLAFLIPSLSFAAFPAGFMGTSTSQGWILPLRINGIDPTILAPRFIASTTVSSVFPFASSTGISLSSFLLVDNGGKVGIATTTPMWPLQIASSAQPQLSLTDGITSPHWVFRNAGGNLYLATTSPTTFATTSTSTMAFLNNGNIGIGTNIPTHKLTFSNVSNGIAVYNTGDQTTDYERVLFNWISNQFNIVTQKGGLGSNRDINLQASGNVRLKSGGVVYLNPDVTNQATEVGTGSTFTTAGLGAFRVRGTFNNSSGGSGIGLKIDPTMTQTGPAGYTMLDINPTESTVGTGAKLLINAQVGSATKFIVKNDGQTGINVSNTPVAMFHVASTTNLARFGYDTSNYMNLDVSSTGTTTFDSIGGFSGFNFSDEVGIASSSPFANFAINPTAGVASNQFVIGSSTATNLIVDNAGRMALSTTTSSALLSLGANPKSTQASTTIKMGRIQFEGVDSGGNKRCTFISSAGTWEILAGSCIE